MVVIAHNIRSLHNVGAILRTADAVGTSKVYLSGITPSPLDRFGAIRSDVAKTALGAERSVGWENVASTSKLIAKLKRQGMKIVALEQAEGSVPYTDISPKKFPFENIALILGAEVEGVPAAILKRCDTIVEIPMAGAKESLNVSVAFGIVAFQLRYAR